ncbi:MAG TPA: phage tail sheath C-terminal domain-containing protein [Pyrinomonadaceae bacterium]|nr:phage tail sheath C-terminal domain-containing protein [Pyrinomonadaceae bacterium]
MNRTRPGVSIEENPASPQVISGVQTSITAFVGRTPTGPVGTDGDGPVAVQSFEEYERIFGGLSLESPLGYTVRDFFLNGGSTALIVRLVEPGGQAASSTKDASGPKLSPQTYIDGAIAALDRVDLFNLLCVPPDSLDPADTEAKRDTDNAVYQSLAVYCVKRRAMLILDAPVSWADSARRDAFNEIQPTYFGIAGETQRNAAVYFPRVVEADILRNGAPTVMPACGAVAGIYAMTDASRGVWKAPSGTEAGISGILQLEINLTDDQNELLNPLGINCLRSFPTYGPVVWGARTLRGADVLEDDYKYVPIRRLWLYLEESIDRGTAWTVFEPNGEQLWAAVRISVENFLAELQRQGAFYSFFVQCDGTTTTQEDIDQGLFNILIGVAPLKPAEFIVIQIQKLLKGNNEDDEDKP